METYPGAGAQLSHYITEPCDHNAVTAQRIGDTTGYMHSGTKETVQDPARRKSLILGKRGQRF